MPRTAAQATYADFAANSDPAAVLAAVTAAPRATVAAVHKDLTGIDAAPTAFYNLAKSLTAIRDGESYMAGNREYGNPNRANSDDKVFVPMQGGLTFASLNTLTNAFAERGAALYPKSESNGNGNGESGSAAPSGTAATPVTTSGQGPLPVAPELFDTVKSLQERFAAEDAAAPVTGRAFLETLWNATPEEERNRRVNSIARAFVEARESGSRRGEIRTMIDSLSRALKDDGAIAADLDIWTFIYNRALPEAAQSESYEQIKSNLKNAYRFDPDAAAFRDWETSLTAQAAAFVEMFGKDLGLTAEAVIAKSALKRTRETLDSIMSGMRVAQSRFEEWETRALRAAAPAAPVVERIPFADLPAPVQSAVAVGEDVWNTVLTPEQQRQMLASRSIVDVDGVWTLAAERKEAEANKKSGK